MLVLTRKLNEEIVIGDNVKVTVLQVKGNSVRLGIEAPRDIKIVRGELAPQTTKAEVTVVFSGDRSEAGTRVDRIPFTPGASHGRDRLTGTCDEPVATEPGRAVHSREALPGVFHRNRLQQIVDEVTGK